MLTLSKQGSGTATSVAAAVSLLCAGVGSLDGTGNTTGQKNNQTRAATRGWIRNKPSSGAVLQLSWDGGVTYPTTLEAGASLDLAQPAANVYVKTAASTADYEYDVAADV